MGKFENSFEIPDSILNSKVKLDEFLDQAYATFCVNYVNSMKNVINFSQQRISREKKEENRTVEYIYFSANETKEKLKDEIIKHGTNYKLDISKKIKVSKDDTTESSLENEKVKI